MRQLVVNGPHEYPGASMVEYEDGHQIDLVRSMIIAIHIGIDDDAFLVQVES